MDTVVILRFLEISCLIETVNKISMNYKARRQKSVSRRHFRQPYFATHILVDTFYINHSLGRGPPPTHFETCKIHLFGLVEVLMWLVECFALALSCCHHQFYWVEREGGSTEKQLGIDLHSAHPCSP